MVPLKGVGGGIWYGMVQNHVVLTQQLVLNGAPNKDSTVADILNQL